MNVGGIVTGAGGKKNRRGRNHDGHGRDLNGRGLEKYGRPRGSRRTQYNNFLHDMNLQEVYIIEKLKRKRKKLVVNIKRYLLIFFQKICNTF
jgi:hypothetical protein